LPVKVLSAVVAFMSAQPRPPVFEFQQARDQLSRTATQIGHCSAVLDCALQQADSLWVGL